MLKYTQYAVIITLVVLTCYAIAYSYHQSRINDMEGRINYLIQNYYDLGYLHQQNGKPKADIRGKFLGYGRTAKLCEAAYDFGYRQSEVGFERIVDVAVLFRKNKH